jgi:hypothetical protein
MFVIIPTGGTAMKKHLQTLGICFMLSAAFWGCQSKSESMGDKYLKAGDPVNALLQYGNALNESRVSSTFYPNYTKAYILLLQALSEEYLNSDLMDAMRDSVISLLKRHPVPENATLAASVFFDIGQRRIKQETAYYDEKAFQWFMAALSISGRPADIDAKIAEIRKNYTASKLKELESSLANSDANTGITTDYGLNQLALIIGEENPEMKALWSKVRKINLSTYLYFSAPGLLEQVDARINKYGLLMAIVKYEPPPSVLIGVKVWNISSGPIEIDGGNFRLVDRKGNAYEPTKTLQALKKKTAVEIRKESEQGGLVFKLPKGAEPDYLELKVEDGRMSRKYLP